MIKKNTALVVAGVFMGISFFFPIKAKAQVDTERIYGMNRYETAVEVSKKAWDTSETVVVVMGENFPDAVCAAPLAKNLNAPILLTESSKLTSTTSSEIRRLGAKSAYIVGGKVVVLPAVEEQLTSMGLKVTRLGGANRYDTSLLVANQIKGYKEVALVNGDEFGDAISIAPIAAQKGMPILLTPSNGLTPTISKAIGNKKNLKTIVVGGEDIISAEATKNLIDFERINGNTKYERNYNIIKRFAHYIDFSNLYVATGYDYPDALTGSAIAAKQSSAVILVENEIAPEVKDLLNSKVINKITVLGGPAAVRINIEDSLRYLPLEVSSANNITNTVEQDKPYTPPPTVVITASDGSKQEVPVKWNFTKLETGRPGTYNFKGTIDGYSNEVTLTLFVKPVIVSIADIKEETIQLDDYEFPKTVPALMSDNQMEDVDVLWNYEPQDRANAKGGMEKQVLTFHGTVQGYDDGKTPPTLKQIKLELTLGIIPDTVNIESVPTVKVEVTQGDIYTFAEKMPEVMAQMKNGTKKEFPVIWNDKEADTSKPGIFNYEGQISGYQESIYLELVVKPIVEFIWDIVQETNDPKAYTFPKTFMAKYSDGTSGPANVVTWKDKRGLEGKAVKDTDVQKITIAPLEVKVREYFATVNGYSRDVKLTLTLGSNVVIITSLADLVQETDQPENYSYPKTVTGFYSNDTTSAVDVTWSKPQKVVEISDNGSSVEVDAKNYADLKKIAEIYKIAEKVQPTLVLTYEGTVKNYSGKSTLTLTIKPATISYIEPTSLTIDVTQDAKLDLLEKVKDKYKYPVTAIKSNGLKEDVTAEIEWDLIAPGKASKIDTTNVGKIFITGVLKIVDGSKKTLNWKINITPKILTVYNLSKEIIRGDDLVLPSKVTAVLGDKTMRQENVRWEYNVIDTNVIKTYVVKGYIETYSKPVTYTLTVVRDMPVSFKDANLEKIIREACGKTTGTLYKSDVQKIEKLTAVGKSVSNLYGLKELKKLKELNLEDNAIKDISELASLKDLWKLEIAKNKISNLDSLKLLYEMKYLDLRENSITTLHSIENLSQITTLKLKGNLISDFSPITYFYDKITDKDFMK